MTVMISSDEHEVKSLTQSADDFAKLRFQCLHRNCPMDDVTEQHDLPCVVAVDQIGYALERIFLRRNRQQLAGMPVRPRVTEV